MSVASDPAAITIPLHSIPVVRENDITPQRESNTVENPCRWIRWRPQFLHHRAHAHDFDHPEKHCCRVGLPGQASALTVDPAEPEVEDQGLVRAKHTPPAIKQAVLSSAVVATRCVLACNRHLLDLATFDTGSNGVLIGLLEGAGSPPPSAC